MRGGRWTTEEIDIVGTMAKEGASAAEISDELPGRSRSAVIGLCYRYDFQLRSTSNWSTAEIETLRQLAGKEMTASEIAKRLPGRTRSAVIGACYRNDISLPFATGPRQSFTLAQLNYIAYLRRRGLRDEDIARDTGRSRSTIQAARQRYQIP